LAVSTNEKKTDNSSSSDKSDILGASCIFEKSVLEANISEIEEIQRQKSLFLRRLLLL
jgi:hypothetical protein